MNELPLIELFDRLREAGLPIGMGEYQSVLQAMQAGFGVGDRLALKRLCQTVWVKSAEELPLFEFHFEQVMGTEVIQETSGVQESRVVNFLKETRFLSFLVPVQQLYLHRMTRYVILGSLAVGIAFGVKTSVKLTQTSPPITPTPIPAPTNVSSKPTIIRTQQVTLVPNTIQQAPPNTDDRLSNGILWFVLSVIVLSGGYVIVKWRPNILATRFLPKNQVSTSSQATPKATSSTTDSALTSTDEVQIAQAVLTNNPKNLFLKDEHFPVTMRQMKQIWRYLRRPVRQGSRTELDMEATINQIGQQGLLFEPVLRPSRVNSAEMLLLIDQDGSMVPFGGLSRRLVETALRGGRLGKAGIYYFHNCPLDYLYHDPNHLKPELVSDIVNRVSSDRTAVLILSDAGAARGGYSEERYELTQKFLAQLKQRVRYMAWLNPIPNTRWAGTTAGEIARLVPMFELSRRGLQDAVSVLRGRPTNFEGRKI
ncbi:hypothetical protein F7734_30245 [Scytonema sp. UIC 10036]|nr:hypothetical protein [Scytonema sp. UIC 10036]